MSFSRVFAARRYASAVYSVLMCPSVRPSVTSRDCIKMAKHGIKTTRPHDTHWLCFLMPKISAKYILSTICLHESHVLVTSTVFWKMKDFWTSHAVTYTVNVVLSWKQCKIKSKEFLSVNYSRCLYFCWLSLENTYKSDTIPMTLSEAEGHLPTASLFTCDFSYSYRTRLDEMSIDIVRRAVSLRF